MSNLTYSLVYRFVPGSAARNEFMPVAEDMAKRYHVSIILGKDDRVILAGAVAEEVVPLLTATGLSPYMDWPRDIISCEMQTPLPLYAVGMEDGWEIFTGEQVFVGFVSMPGDAVEILERAGEYYTREERFETLPEFVERVGLTEFRRRALAVEAEPTPGVSALPPEYISGGEFYGFAATEPGEFSERPPAADLHYGDFVRPEMNLMRILTVYPEMGPLFMEYGMHCIGCVASYDESLWEACQVHGLDVFEILGEMNEYLADKLGKANVDGTTPMQDMFTLYPQTVSVLQQYGIPFPDDMQTTLADAADAAGVSLKDVLDQVHRTLRKE